MIIMVIFEESMIFFPEAHPGGFWDVEAVARGSGTTVEDCYFDASDGTRLHGWWCRPTEPGLLSLPTSEMVLLWFHGNAGNLSHRSELMLELAKIPVQVLIVDYRGYGRSAGRPSEKGLYRDARAAWRYIVEERSVDAHRIVILGKSLGGAVAVDLAAETDPAGLIVESSFASVPDMAARHYPFIPRWLIRTKMDSLAKIGRVDCPVMVVHSPADEVVPFDHGRRLFDAVPGDRRFLEVQGARHNELWLVAGTDYVRAIREFLLDCRDRVKGGK
jgi:fermentation-respiration switch protein FrsA (DUF1100 family)